MIASNTNNTSNIGNNMYNKMKKTRKGIIEMKSTISKRLVALCMAFAMMFSLMTVVHAEDVSDGLSKPTTHTEVAKPATVTSISVGSATAYYETDDNTGSTTYILSLIHI